MTIRALVLDFDGTIVDTESLDFQCWQEIYRGENCELLMGPWSQCVGTVTDAFHPVKHLENLTGRSFDHAEMMATHHRQFVDLSMKLPVAPGVCGWITEALDRGLSIGVASSSRREWVEGHLEHRGLMTSIAAVRCSNDVARVKPAPDLYRAVIGALGVAPAQAIAVEDSPNGVCAAKAAGLFCVAVPNPITAQLGITGADLHLSSLEEMALAEVIALASGRTRSA